MRARYPQCVADPAPNRKLPLALGPPSGQAGAGPDKPRKRLPVLQTNEDDQGEDRPPWHWSGIGTVAIFLAWLPLAALGNTLLGRLLQSVDPGQGAAPSMGAVSVWVRLGIVGLNALLFGAASFAGGFLVGRFGGRAGTRQATVSGLAAALVAWALTLAKSVSAGTLGWLLLLAAIAALGAGGAYLGGRHGLRRRFAAR